MSDAVSYFVAGKTAFATSVCFLHISGKVYHEDRHDILLTWYYTVDDVTPFSSKFAVFDAAVEATLTNKDPE